MCVLNKSISTLFIILVNDKLPFYEDNIHIHNNLVMHVLSLIRANTNYLLRINRDEGFFPCIYEFDFYNYLLRYYCTYIIFWI